MTPHLRLEPQTHERLFQLEETSISRMNDERPTGWVKPHRPRTMLELKQLIQEKEVELRALHDELYNLENGPRLEAVARIRNIMRAQQLTLADIATH